jgi:hypothetical protein
MRVEQPALKVLRHADDMLPCASTGSGQQQPRQPIPAILIKSLRFIKCSLSVDSFCQKLTTELTEKMFYFKKLTEILLPPLCVLSYLFSFSFYSGKMYQLSPA